MSVKQKKTLIFMCWLLYVSAYLGRYSYSSNQLPISLHYGVSDFEVGLATSCFFFAYGAGQIINGLLCRYYNVKYVLSIALFVSVIINLLVFLGIPFVLIKYVWLINGIAQSVLWSSLLMTLSQNLDGKYIRKSIVVMSTTAGVGTLVSYCISALFAIIDGFKYCFLIASIIMLVSAVAWFFLLPKVAVQYKPNTEKTSPENQADNSVKSKQKIHPSAIYTFFVFGFFAIIVNLMKDGLTGWVPKIMFDQFGLDESLSIFVTLILPLLAVFGTVVVVWLNKKIKEYTLLMSIVFICASIFTGVVLVLFDTPLWIIVLVSLGAIALFMSGANNIITSMLPLSMRDKANSGFVAGILNGCCYVGSTLSSACLGAISDSYGWKPAFLLFLALCVVVVVVSAVCVIFSHINAKRKKQISVNQSEGGDEAGQVIE